MNVYDQAHGLASAIKASEEFKQYDALKKQIDANADLSKMLKDFQAKQLEFQTKQMMGGMKEAKPKKVDHRTVSELRAAKVSHKKKEVSLKQPSPSRV